RTCSEVVSPAGTRCSPFAAPNPCPDRPRSVRVDRLEDGNGVQFAPTQVEAADIGSAFVWQRNCSCTRHEVALPAGIDKCKAASASPQKIGRAGRVGAVGGAVSEKHQARLLVAGGGGGGMCAAGLLKHIGE